MTDTKTTIGLASDHAGYGLKQYVIQYLESRGMKYEDFGCTSETSCDYPDFAHALGSAVDEGRISTGIAICGTGEGMAMALNKHQKVRAALCWAPEIAHLARQHNNSNVLVMPGRFISEKQAEAIMNEYFSTDFEGGRHVKRIDKIPLCNKA